MRFFLFFFILCISVQARIPPRYKHNNMTYRTYFGACPDRSSSDLVIQIVKIFEKNYSLKEVKEKIVSEKWQEKYFLNDYRLSYHPIKKQLSVHFHCPKPLARVQVYKDNGQEHYTATLTVGGKLFDPSYEVLMKNEKKLMFDLPALVMSIQLINSGEQAKIADFLHLLKDSFLKRTSEIIYNDRFELTLIMNNSLSTTSIFLGKDLWDHKLSKLEKILTYMDRSQRNPSVINLSHSKKVVVKF
jgi:hypothetical protein